MHHLDQGTCTTCSWLGTHQTPFGHINTVTIISRYKPWIKCLSIITQLNLPQEDSSSWTLLTTGHLLINSPYGNASVAALQFQTEDLDPQTLSSTIKRVYTAFFYSDSAQQLWHVEEVLFSHFVTTSNNAFEQALTSEDIGYIGYYIGNHNHFTFPYKKIYAYVNFSFCLTSCIIKVSLQQNS